MQSRGWAWLVIATGCGRLLGIDEPQPSCLVDPFDGSQLDLASWLIADEAASPVVRVESGQLRLELRANEATYNGITTTAVFDMRGASVQVEAVELVNQDLNNGGGADQGFGFRYDALNSCVMSASANELVSQCVIDGVFHRTPVKIEAVAMRYWRISSQPDEDRVTFETSPDLIQWTPRGLTKSIPDAAVTLSLYAGDGRPTLDISAPGVGVFDNFRFATASACPQP